MSYVEYVPDELVEHKDRAVVSVLNANRDATEEEAEEMINAIVNLVFEKRGQDGYQALYDEMMLIWEWRKQNDSK